MGGGEGREKEGGVRRGTTVDLSAERNDSRSITYL